MYVSLSYYFFVYFSVHIIISHVMCHYYDIVSFALLNKEILNLKKKAVQLMEISNLVIESIHLAAFHVHKSH